jgi:hypothetical protein
LRLAEEIENQLTPTEQNLRDNFKNELGIDKTSRYHDLIGILAVSREELPKIVAQPKVLTNLWGERRTGEQVNRSLQDQNTNHTPP